MSFVGRIAGYKYLLLLFMVLVLACTNMAIRTWRYGKQTLSWQATEGKVTQRTTKHTGTGRRRFARPEIHIEYSVNGATYELVVDDSYVLSTPVLVYYDPQQPQAASYYQGVDRGKLLAYGLGASLAGVAFVAHVILAASPDLLSADSRFEDLPPEES